MGEHARVDNVDALKHFRADVFKFAEEANNALGDVEQLALTKHYDHNLLEEVQLYRQAVQEFLKQR